MRLRRWVLAALVFASGCDPAPTTDAGTDARVADGGSAATPLEALQERSRSRIIARLDDAGRLRTLIADLPSEGATPEERATRLAASLPELIPVPDGAELFVVAAADDGTWVELGMRLSDVVIFGAAVRVWFDDAGRVRWVITALPDDPAAAGTTPTIDAADAQAAAREALGLDPGAEGVETPELVILDEVLLDGEGAEPAVLTWTMEAHDGTSDGPVRLFVDAADGAVVTELALATDALSRTVIDAHLGEDKRRLPMTTVLFDDGMPGLPAPDPATEPEAHAVYAHMTPVHAYFFSRYLYDGHDGAGRFRVYVDYGPADGRNATYWRDSVYFNPGMVSLDVLAHEYTHGVIQDNGGLRYRGYTGALNESIADVFAAFIDDAAPWTIGEGTARGVLRDLSDPTAHGQPRHWSSRVSRAEGRCAPRVPGRRRCAEKQRCIRGHCYRDNGWVHVNSGIPNYAAYLLVNGGTHPDPPRVAVRGIGQGKVETFWYAGLVRVHATARFGDFAAAALASCLALEGTRVPGGGEIERRDCGAVINAFAAVGIGTPDVDEDTVVDGEDNCPMRFNPEQEDADDDGTGDACEPGVMLDAGPEPGLYCPAVMPADGGALPLLEEIIGAEPRAPDQTNQITCRYGDGAGESVFVLVQFHTDGALQSSACWTHTRMADDAACSESRQASVRTVAPDDGFQDAAERAFLPTLLAVAEAEAIECPGLVLDDSPCATARITCPATFTNAVGHTLPLTGASETCPMEEPRDPGNYFAFCRYTEEDCGGGVSTAREPGDPASDTWSVSWAEDAATARREFTCTEEIGVQFGAHHYESGARHAYVNYLGGERSAAVDAFGLDLLRSVAEPPAAPCP